MTILFDGGVPLSLREFLPAQEVLTVRWLGWGETVAGPLLRQAEPPAFDVFVTSDAQLPKQRNLSSRCLATLVLRNCRWPLPRPVVPEVVTTILATQPGEHREFVIPRPPRPPGHR